MRVVPNYVYGFTFKKFSATFNNPNSIEYDENAQISDGIFKVLSISSYDEIVANEIDLFAETYEKNNIPKEIFYSSLSNIRKSKIYKLEKKNTEYQEIYYIPEILFKNIPDAYVKRYLDMGIAIKLGIIDNKDKLEVLKTDINQMVVATIGTSGESVVLYTIKEIWMTVNDYNTTQLQKAEVINNTQNLFIKNMNLQYEIDALRTVIQKYEEKISQIESQS